MNSISDLATQVLRDQVPGRDMHVSLRFHGSAGTLLIGGQTIGLGEAGRQNFAAFIGALGGVKRITFLSCETGLGEEGCNFMRRVAQATGAEVRARLAVMKAGPEELHVAPRELYIYFPDGMGRSKLPAAIEKVMKGTGTARNWNSVTKLLEMAEKLDAE